MALPAKPPNQQLYEFLLFGSVSETELTSLLHRLRGLCDFATCGGIEFCDKEQTFKIGQLYTWVRYQNVISKLYIISLYCVCIIIQKLVTHDHWLEFGSH